MKNCERGREKSKTTLEERRGRATNADSPSGLPPVVCAQQRTRLPLYEFRARPNFVLGQQSTVAAAVAGSRKGKAAGRDSIHDEEKLTAGQGMAMVLGSCRWFSLRIMIVSVAWSMLICCFCDILK